MKRNWYGSIGSVSSDTMRECDLIPSFLWEAKNLRLTKEERKQVSAISKRADVDEDATYWQSEEAGYDLETLFDILENHSLPYCSFGASDCDGACYGWWLYFDQQDFDGLKVNDTSEVPKGYSGEVLHVNDHGNITLYSASRGRLHEIWAVV